MIRVLACAWTIFRHPAFWAPLLAAFCGDLYYHGLALEGRAIGSDGWGYYLQLPAIFIHGDPHLVFLNGPDLPQDVLQYRSPNQHWQGLSVHGAGYLDKYAFGPAVLQLPFFLIALAIGHFYYVNVNGFEPAFQIANAVSAAVYFGLGSFLIYRACRLRYDRLPSALALASTILATNVLFYASADGSYSHVYGYCILAALVYLTIWRVESGQPPTQSAFVLFGLLMGLAVMVRPTNAVYGLLFLVFARGTPPHELFMGGCCAFLASAVAVSPQIVLWYVTAGRPIYYSYGGEGFKWLSPQLSNYLFSIRKGVFFWHPFYLLMILALPEAWPKRPFETAVTLLIVVLALYIGASWGDYTFGDSFGSRQSVELLPILLVPFCGAIAWLLSSGWKWPAAALALVLIAVNALHYRGYYHGLLPHNNTTAVAYADFWAKTLNWPAIRRLAPPPR
jgi:hypothetical protein